MLMRLCILHIHITDDQPLNAFHNSEALETFEMFKSSKALRAFSLLTERSTHRKHAHDFLVLQHPIQRLFRQQSHRFLLLRCT